MKNLAKVLLLTLCFGLFCLFILHNAPMDRRRYLLYRSERISKIHHYNKIEDESTIINYEITEESRLIMTRDFKNRRNKIKYFCTNMKNSSNATIHKAVKKLIIDTKHKLTWCPIYKSASSMWMKNFAMLSGFPTTLSWYEVHENRSHIDYNLIVKQKFMEKNSQEKLKKITETTKFMVVRHPFERILSAYRDKLEHMQNRDYYYRRYGQYITHRYRSKQSNLTSLEPSFTEFLQFIAKEKQFDEHWIPFFLSCQPCSIDYDYIFKFESLSEEYNFFIAESHLEDHLNYMNNNRKNTSSQGITNDLIAEKYFQQVPVSLLKTIYKIYELDFLLFSYSPAKYYYMTNGSKS